MHASMVCGLFWGLGRLAFGVCILGVRIRVRDGLWISDLRARACITIEKAFVCALHFLWSLGLPRFRS
jgi:hypothetical protein